MTKSAKAVLEEMLSEAEEIPPPQNPYKTYRFPRRFAGKDFPLLFPKSEADEFRIRAIASHFHIDYDSLVSMVREAETNHPTRWDLKRVSNPLKERYGALVAVVKIHGEDYGIDTSQYAIRQPKEWGANSTLSHRNT